MQKKLLSGLFWILLLNLLIKPFWILGIETGVQNAVGPNEYGFYFTIFNLAYIFNILLDLGVTNFNTRNIARHPKLIDKHLPDVLGIKLALLLLYVLVTFTVGLLSGYGSRQFHLLAVLSFNQFLNSMVLYLRSNFEGLMLFKWDSVLSILDRVVMIAICSLMLWGPGPNVTVERFAYAQTAAYLLTALTALAVLTVRIKREHNPRFSLKAVRLSRPFAIVMLRKSLPFALLVLLMASYNRIDPLLLSWLHPHGTYYSGIYAGAFRLLDALTMVAYLVSVPLLPVFSRMTACGQRTAADDKGGDALLGSTTRLVTNLMVVFSMTAAALFSLHSHLFMQLLYRDHVAEYASVFSILVWGIVPISMTYVFGTLLTAAGRLRQLNILAALSLAINIVVNLIAIPRYGAVGSAWAAVAAQTFMAATQIVVAVRSQRLRPTVGFLLRLLLFSLAVVAVAALLPPWPWWASLLATGVAAVVVALPLRLIDVKQLMQIIITEK
ncbi:MAG: polysaccharide biosynthesis C-terminal domain-containing protein [Bacteroidales bacterium]|nr:polysaccharide biosynthesis C-terminal domain-containing protein [Bacteroidales bacterium]